MAQLVKRSPCTHEDLSFIPRATVKMPGGVAGTCNPSARRRRQKYRYLNSILVQTDSSITATAFSSRNSSASPRQQKPLEKFASYIISTLSRDAILYDKRKHNIFG